MLLAAATESFVTAVKSEEYGRVYAPDFGSIRMQRDLEIEEMSERALPSAWENCVRNAMSAKVEVEEEIAKANLQQVWP